MQAGEQALIIVPSFSLALSSSGLALTTLTGAEMVRPGLRGGRAGGGERGVLGGDSTGERGAELQ